MPRIVILILLYHCHKPVDVICIKTCRISIDWPVNISKCIEKDYCKIVHNELEGAWNEVVVDNIRYYSGIYPEEMNEIIKIF
jgi:hypothetical protein